MTDNMDGLFSEVVEGFDSLYVHPGQHDALDDAIIDNLPDDEQDDEEVE